MKRHVTVVPSDKPIIVDGTVLRFDFPALENVHALQWHEESGHIEWTDDDINHSLTPADYAEDVAPLVTLREAEKARLEELSHKGAFVMACIIASSPQHGQNAVFFFW